MNTFAIFVRSGLCNRLRVVLSAIAFCERTNRKLAIHWPIVDNAEPRGTFDARLSDLFDHPFRELTEQEWASTGRPVKQQDLTFDTPGDLHIRTINMFPGIKCPPYIPNPSNLHDFLASRAHYTKSFADYFSVFRPSRAVQEIIDEESAKFSDDMVGVSVRYNGANVLTPSLSSPEKFIERMRRFDSRKKFFLNTDGKNTSDVIADAFPGRVQQIEQNFIYDKRGIVVRTAELYLLARCQHILGSSYSSYSEFAGWLAGSRYSRCYLWRGDPGDRYEDIGEPFEHEL